MSRRSYEITDVDSSASCNVDSIDAESVEFARNAAPDERTVGALAEAFSALGDPTRVRILMALDARELCVCDIAAVVGVSQSAVSHQLRTLRQLDLVSYRREGKRAVYSLADDHVKTLIEQGRDHVSERLGGYHG
jgi:ArsR family transcriptional regulator